MKFSRRDLLKFTGGASAGLVLSPMPWGLVHDATIRSETWPGVPQPPRGEVHTRYTTCTLCPAGCGVRARCVGDRPVSLVGVNGLCPEGLVGHHLAFCAQRAHAKPAAIDAAVAKVSAAAKQSTVAIIDPRPGRVASQIYQRFLTGLPNGIYCPAPTPWGPFGIDLENTRTILSFSAPVLDGWMTPGRVLSNRDHLQLIQVEATYSRTASLADLWVPIAAGGEMEFAAALAQVLEGKPPQDERVARVARMLQNRPAIAVGGGATVARLNVLLNSIGQPGGFLPRREPATMGTDFAAVPDHSIGVLLIEEATWGDRIAPELLKRKMIESGGVVVALTSWLDGYARDADYVIPSPVYLEAMDEAASPTDSVVASFSLSPPLMHSPAASIAPADFVLRLAGESTTYSDLLKQRAAAIYKDARGSLATYSDAKSVRIASVPSADDFWKALLAGAVWRDDPLPASPKGFRWGPQIAANRGRHASPLMTKLYRESGLRRA